MSLYTKIIDLQKLCEAWKKVKSNKPAAGIDEVSYEEFDHGIRENLKQLHLELEEHRYEALPVKLVDIYKGEKKRTISLFSMRDKVLHQAIAAELTKLYDAEFSDCTYAYRPGRAALQAIEYLGEEIKRNENAWLLKADIKDFFDSVLQDKLYHTLRVKIHDEDVIELIKECCEVRELQKDGELRKKTRGISQGSGIAPILSNIYLKKFDIEMKQDVYGKEKLESHKKRCVEQVSEPLTEDVIRKHLQGKITVSTFIQRSNATAKYLVIDVDISKRVLCQGIEEENIRKYLPQAAETVKDIFKLLNKMGLKVYLEDSGFRGHHIWLFFTEWIPVRYIIMLSEIIENNRTIKNESISVEYFPNKSKLRGGSLGQKIKLPLGFHVHTIKRSIFMDSDFHKVKADKRYFMEVAKFSLLAIKKIIAFHNNTEEKIEEKEVDMDLKYFGEISDSIKVVLEKCSLMRYLCQKAKTTGYLTHYERMSILYVFGHLGEEGKMFVHTVMELTLNYQYHVTDKFIQKIPAKPVSCLKLREQYKQITAEYGCSCNFKRTKDCYPSPVLHAIKSSEDVAGDITIPTSRTLTKAKEKKVVEEINIHKKVQELAQKIIEMKKQRRGVDKAIQKTENELEKIYDQAGIDCLEVDMGLLVRRRKEQGYEWLIEI